MMLWIRKMFNLKHTFFAVCFVFFLYGCSDSASVKDLEKKTFKHHSLVGFFAPSSVNPDFASEVDIQLLNLSTVEHLKSNLSLAKENNLLLYIDIGSVINPEMPQERIGLEYHLDGMQYQKILVPKKEVKLRTTLQGEQLQTILSPYLQVMQSYPETVSAVFLADEPYLNGISYQQLGDLSRDVRIILDRYNLEHVKIGTIFASAMFNSDFAQHIDRASALYVRGIDSYYSSLVDRKASGAITQEELTWLDIINDVRLTTYDMAGNMYVGGGIPEFIDLVGFNYYLSTLLKDFVHNESLHWFAVNKVHPSCLVFKNTTMIELRRDLSFWGAETAGISSSSYLQDKKILDGWYTCRTESAFLMLENEIKQSSRPVRDVVLTSESSSNGFMLFDLQGNIVRGQDMKQTHARIRDEVHRAFQFINKHPVNSLLFFTYDNEFDYSINLSIGGVSDSKEALDLIFRNAQRSRQK